MMKYFKYHTASTNVASLCSDTTKAKTHLHFTQIAHVSVVTIGMISSLVTVLKFNTVMCNSNTLLQMRSNTTS